MILVANGGLGSAYDELELNRGICEKYGIKVRGVVLNKVRVGREHVSSFFSLRCLVLFFICSSFAHICSHLLLSFFPLFPLFVLFALIFFSSIWSICSICSIHYYIRFLHMIYLIFFFLLFPSFSCSLLSFFGLSSLFFLLFSLYLHFLSHFFHCRPATVVQRNRVGPCSGMLTSRTERGA